MMVKNEKRKKQLQFVALFLIGWIIGEILMNL